MAELLRARVEELVGTPVSAFCFPEDTAEARARIAANLTGQRMDFEFRFRRTDGTPLYVLAATAPLYGPGGEIAGALGGFLNIAERKAAEEHQRFLMRELSHRSKNLLAVIQAIARQTGRSADRLRTSRHISRNACKGSPPRTTCSSIRIGLARRLSPSFTSTSIPS